VDFDYNNIEQYYDKAYWDEPGVKSGYTWMTQSVGGEWHDQACGWFNSVISVRRKSLFDAGCGLGHFMTGFRKLGADAYGCDASDFCVQEVAKRFPKKVFHSRLEFIGNVCEQLFDIVFCVSTMEHIPNHLINLVFNNLISLCKSGGYIYIEIDTTPNTQKPVPEDSHVNIRPWPLWLLKIDKGRFPWSRDLGAESALRATEDFPGFPHPGWNFVVLRKNTKKQNYSIY